MNVYARFDEIPSITHKDIKKTKRNGLTHARTDGWTDNVKTVCPPTNTVCGGYNDHFRSNTDPCYIQNRTCYKEVEVYMYLYIAFNFACTVDVFASV